MFKTYHLITYGCQMNKSDSERIAAVLEKIGYSPTSKKEEADLIIINVCSVRQSAVDRIYGKISQISQLKTQNHNLKPIIILTGCILPKDKKRLKEKVDFILEIKDLNKWPEIISKPKSQKPKRQLKTKNYLEIKPNYSTFPIAYVPIMTGCDNFCTYCVVPYTRGREISRPVEEIICEVKELIKRGYKMIILLGQNVNSYQEKFKSQKSKIIKFPELLKIVNDLPGNFWLTFITSHPKDLSDELIEAMANCKKVMSYLHLPVQSGDNQILKKMNRHYTISHYKKLIRAIRARFVKISKLPICISTDIIVGFPSETKKQFENTAKLMKEIKFDMAYIAKYSPRPGTIAEKLKDNVPQKEKERRWKVLTKILKKTALENNKKYLNQVIEVLITENKGDYLLGQSKSFKNVKINHDLKQKSRIGDIIKVIITKAISWGLEGKLIFKFCQTTQTF